MTTDNVSFKMALQSSQAALAIQLEENEAKEQHIRNLAADAKRKSSKELVNEELDISHAVAASGLNHHII